MDRLVSLSVGTEGAEDYFSTFQDISELAKNLGATHRYVNVNANVFDELEIDPEPEQEVESLYYDENTLAKVRQVMTNAVLPEIAESLITDLQNAGILFRERPKNEER